MKNSVVVYNSQSTAIAVIPRFQITTILKSKIEDSAVKEYDLERAEIVNMPNYKQITENRMPLKVYGYTKIPGGEERHEHTIYVSICEEL